MSRANNFDAVRIVAAIAVIFGHAWALSGGLAPQIAGNPVQSAAVKVFFVVSGFLVAKSWMADPDVTRFLVRRALRLFPGLALVLLLTALVLGTCVTVLPTSEYLLHDRTWRYISANLMLFPEHALPGVFEQTPYPFAVNGSLWSLPVEVLMYLLVPVASLLAIVSRNLLMVVAAALAVACIVAITPSGLAPGVGIVWGTSLRSVADVAPFFAVGALFARPRFERLLDPAVALLLVGAAAFFQWPNAAFLQLAMIIALPYAVLAFATRATPIVCNAGRWGDPSYGVYLYGFPIQQTLFHLFPDMRPLANAACAMPIALAAGYASWHLVEKYALSLKPRTRAFPRREAHAT